MEQPFVSVVMPVFNTAHFLPETIESILNQSYAHFEFLIIDDASPDHSMQVIEDYARKDKRIITISNPHNLGVVGTRNKGVQRARGKYVALMDGDDVALPERLATQVDFMEKNPDCGACGSNVYQINAESIVTGKVTFPSEDREIKNAFFFITPVRHSTVMVQRECFEKVGLYQENVPEELDLFMRIGCKYKLANLHDFLLKYRVHGSNYILANQKRVIAWTLTARRNAVNKYGYKMPFLGYAAYFATWLMQFFPPTLVFNIFYLLRKLIVPADRVSES
jgi:glycosyltransferase involved in cell wall biosynthesis